MLAFMEAHPNIDAMFFYMLGSGILGATLYYFHQKRA